MHLKSKKGKTNYTTKGNSNFYRGRTQGKISQGSMLKTGALKLRENHSQLM